MNSTQCNNIPFSFNVCYRLCENQPYKTMIYRC